MTKAAGAAFRLAEALAIVLGTNEIPVRLRAWDGSEAGPADAPVLVFRARRALRRMLWSPGQLGLSRAYVAGEVDAPGDIFASFAALSSVGKFAGTDIQGRRPARRAGAEPRAAPGGSKNPAPRPQPHQEPRRPCDFASLRHRQRLLRPRPRPVDGLLVCGLE
jgi:cyclopropane-fatty-acyl-phospholipid synthase